MASSRRALIRVLEIRRPPLVLTVYPTPTIDRRLTFDLNPETDGVKGGEVRSVSAKI
jgi:hypothetical protein